MGGGNFEHAARLQLLRNHNWRPMIKYRDEIISNYFIWIFSSEFADVMQHTWLENGTVGQVNAVAGIALIQRLLHHPVPMLAHKQWFRRPHKNQTRVCDLFAERRQGDAMLF